ncbi:MAG: hypothetical protein KJ914_02405 [Gammaproteobacteria bacterium]|nr:hypothetical protein [Gammaproteobacteria bacterium]MBU1722572.1 hypothetical protein [Gammaproteobacteria bacterium]MBU2007044.1 hypothetical protein [Gammaproteobacteria bacterium]
MRDHTATANLFADLHRCPESEEQQRLFQPLFLILRINRQLPKQDGRNGSGAIALFGFWQEFAADFRSRQGNETSDFA